MKRKNFGIEKVVSILNVMMFLSIIIFASCSSDEYEFQVINSSDYDFYEMQLGEHNNLSLESNTTLEGIIVERGTFQEGVHVSVKEFKHMSPDSNKIYQNTIGKFYTFPAFDCDEINVIDINVNFNKQSNHENDFIEIEILKWINEHHITSDYDSMLPLVAHCMSQPLQVIN